MRLTTTKKPGGANILQYEFDSIGDLTRFIATAPNNNVFSRNSDCSSQKTDRSDWFGTKNYQEAMDLLASGWVPQAQKMAVKVPLKPISSGVKSSKPTYDVVGHQASVPRYLQGIPTNMISRKPDTKKQKIVDVAINITQSSMRTTEEIEERGVKALQIVQSVEGKGFRVKLSAFFTTGVGAETIIIKVVIKKPEERFALSKLAFPLVHPSMLRRIMFRAVETVPALTNHNFLGGYGNVPKGEQDYKEVQPKGEIIIPYALTDVEKFVESLGLK